MTTQSNQLKQLLAAIVSGDRMLADTKIAQLEQAELLESSAALLAHLKKKHQSSSIGLEPTNPKAHWPTKPICGRYFRLPDLANGRLAEGGLRLKNQYKRNQPDSPLVTIVTVVFNNQAYIEQCIKSVLDQTYQNIEYIVIDGGSNDGTQSIIERHLGSIDYYVSEPDDGIYNAMNKGLSLARGEYIAFLNADDFYLSTAVEASVENLHSNNCDISYAGFTYIGDEGISVLADEGRKWEESLLIQGVMGGHETCFVHKDCYNQIGGYDEAYRLAADYHWMTRAFISGFDAKHLNKNILVMRMGGASSHATTEYDENLRILREIFPSISDQEAELLYKMKYYRHWHGNTMSDGELFGLLTQIDNKPKTYQKALFQSFENLKSPLTGLISPQIKQDAKQLKIAIALTYMTGTSGGAERIATEAANELADRGHAVTFVSCHGLGGEPFYPLRADIPYIDLAIHPYKTEYYELGSGIEITNETVITHKIGELDHIPTEQEARAWQDAAHLWRTRVYAGFFKKHEFDVIISHMPSTFPYVLFGRSIHSRDPLHIAALHNAPSFKFYSDLYPSEGDTDKYMRLAALGHADKIAVLFDEFTEQMPAPYRDNCFTLPNFISPDILGQTDAVRHVDKTILSVGRLDIQKDQETLIRAFSAIKANYPDWSLKIYGDGPLRDKLTEVCLDCQLDPAEILLGTRKDIYNAYKSAAIFAFPSLFEGFGLTVLEAMSFGVPAIGFDDCEGVKYLIQDQANGLLASRTDSNRSLSRCLSELIENEPLRRKLGDGARKVSQSFNVSSHVDILEGEFAKALNGHTSKPEPLTEPPLTVAIIGTYREGGAGIAAVRLQNGLIEAGDSPIFLSFSPSVGPRQLQVSLTKESQRLFDISQDKFRPPVTKPDSTYFSSSLAGLTKDQVQFLKYFDIVNLHWTENLISVDTLAALDELDVPIVWTLHDMRPFTGGCHYSDGCEAYTKDCSNCPQLSKPEQPYAEQALALRGQAMPANLTIVTPSHWLADCARRSKLFKDRKVVVIPNGLNLNTYYPREQQPVREKYGLPKDKKLLLFTCHSHAERRKGFKEFVTTMEILAQSRDDIHLVTLGHGNGNLDNLPFKYTALGHRSDQDELAEIYSAVDATILPTLEDNLPNVILESVACGTPVVAFDSGGVSDAVIEGKTGFLAPTSDCPALAEKIERALSRSLRENCQAHAMTHFSLEKQANAYKRLFAEIKHRENKTQSRNSRAAPSVIALSKQLELMRLQSKISS